MKSFIFNQDPMRTDIMGLAATTKGYSILSARTKDPKEYGSFQKKVADYNAKGIARCEEWLRIAEPGNSGQRNTDDWFKAEAVKVWKGGGGRSGILNQVDSMYDGHETLPADSIQHIISSYEKNFVEAPTPKSVDELVAERVEAFKKDELPGMIAQAIKVKEAQEAQEEPAED